MDCNNGTIDTVDDGSGPVSSSNYAALESPGYANAQRMMLRDIEDVRDEIVSDWHDGQFPGQSLPEALGMTEKQYAEWVSGVKEE